MAATAAARCLCLGLLFASGCSMRAADQPQAQRDRSAIPARIVSMNPCIDAILRDIAAPSQIAAVSHYSQDPRATSVPLEWARQFPAVGDGAEDVIAAAPDLVITGPHVAPQTAAALQRLGVAVLSVGVPATVTESEAQIMEISRAIGREAQGRAAVERIERALAAARMPVGPDAPSALIWQDGGLVPGPGTLADELLRETGFRSASAAQGLAQWDMISLEDLLWHPPDVLMTGRSGMESDGSSGDRVTHHGVLGGMAARTMIAPFPSSMLHCGGPVIGRTVARLAEIRRSWRQDHGA